MTSIRIYAAARDRKLSSEALLKILRELGFTPKSHMSVFTPEMEVAVDKKIEEERQAIKKEIEHKEKIAAEVAKKRLEGEKHSSQPLSRRQLNKLIKGGLHKHSKKYKGSPKAGTTVQKIKEKKKVDKKEVKAALKKTLTALDGHKKAKHYHKKEQKQIDGEGGEKFINVIEFMTVGELANLMNVKPAEAVSKLMSLGVMATINQRLDIDTITMVAMEFGYEVRQETELVVEEEETDEEHLVPRAPVVTIMGHVDHGKTSLLDYIRRSNIIGRESGGITQHIGAYEVKVGDGSITFIDTPGHHAFTAMRARGAQVTDIVVLVVAVDDNIMPQTVEAISHARAAGVPIVVAINKMDLPGANSEPVKAQLANYNLLPEDWGGKTIVCEVSAKTGMGIDNLLEMILLQAEMMEFKANPKKRASGTILEAKLDKGRGPLINVLIQDGTLRIGDCFVTGTHYGKVRAMFNDWGERAEIAGPSTPVQILGSSGIPQAGDSFVSVEDEVTAKDIAQKRARLKREHDIRRAKPVTLTDVYDLIQEGSVKELNLIIKGDVDGSVEALSGTLQKLSTDEVKVNVIHSGVGAITESDVLLASSSQAVIIGFHVRPDARAIEIGSHEGVDIRLYTVIYEAEEDIRRALEGLLEPDVIENIVGMVEVRELFRVPKVGVIAGCFVLKGVVKRGGKARIVRDGVVIYEGTISSLKRFKDDVREVLEGYECGIGIENFNDLKIGDIFEIIETTEVARKLDSGIGVE